MRARFIAFGAWFWVSLCMGGCASRSDVALSATVKDTEAQLEPGVFGLSLRGAFTLVLQLGKYAEGDTSVSLLRFSLTEYAGDVESTSLPLELAPVDLSLPVSVGKEERIEVKLQVKPSPVSTENAEALCAGPVVYRGAVSDTLSGRVTEVIGPPFALTCPQ